MLCGLQCGAKSPNSTTIKAFAERNEILAVDSYTEYKHGRFVSPAGDTPGSGGHIVRDIKKIVASLAPGQPLIVTLQVMMIFVYCRHIQSSTAYSSSSF